MMKLPTLSSIEGKSVGSSPSGAPNSDGRHNNTDTKVISDGSNRRHPNRLRRSPGPEDRSQQSFRQLELLRQTTDSSMDSPVGMSLTGPRHNRRERRRQSKERDLMNWQVLGESVSPVHGAAVISQEEADQIKRAVSDEIIGAHDDEDERSMWDGAKEIEEEMDFLDEDVFDPSSLGRDFAALRPQTVGGTRGQYKVKPNTQQSSSRPQSRAYERKLKRPPSIGILPRSWTKADLLKEKEEANSPKLPSVHNSPSNTSSPMKRGVSFTETKTVRQRPATVSEMHSLVEGDEVGEERSDEVGQDPHELSPSPDEDGGYEDEVEDEYLEQTYPQVRVGNPYSWSPLASPSDLIQRRPQLPRDAPFARLTVASPLDVQFNPVQKEDSAITLKLSAGDDIGVEPMGDEFPDVSKNQDENGCPPKSSIPGKFRVLDTMPLLPIANEEEMEMVRYRPGHGYEWVKSKFPSMNPASREEIKQLKRAYKDMMAEVREEMVYADKSLKMANEMRVYKAVANEIIRQVHIECAPRGELLHEVMEMINQKVMKFPSKIRKRELIISNLTEDKKDLIAILEPQKKLITELEEKLQEKEDELKEISESRKSVQDNYEELKGQIDYEIKSRHQAEMVKEKTEKEMKEVRFNMSRLQAEAVKAIKEMELEHASRLKTEAEKITLQNKIEQEEQRRLKVEETVVALKQKIQENLQQIALEQTRTKDVEDLLQAEKKVVNKMQSKINDLNTIISKEREEKVEIQKELFTLSETTKDSKAQLAKKQLHIVKLQKELGVIKGKYEISVARVEELESSNSEMLAELEQLRYDKNQLQDKVVQCESDIIDLISHKEQLEASMWQMEQGITIMADKMDALQLTVDESEGLHEHLEEEADALRNKVHLLENEIVRSNYQFQIFQDEVNMRVGGLAEDLLIAHAQSVALLKESKTTKKLLKQAKHNQEKLKGKLELYKTELASARKQLSDVRERNKILIVAIDREKQSKSKMLLMKAALAQVRKELVEARKHIQRQSNLDHRRKVQRTVFLTRAFAHLGLSDVETNVVKTQLMEMEKKENDAMKKRFQEMDLIETSRGMVEKQIKHKERMREKLYKSIEDISGVSKADIKDQRNQMRQKIEILERAVNDLINQYERKTLEIQKMKEEIDDEYHKLEAEAKLADFRPQSTSQSLVSEDRKQQQYQDQMVDQQIDKTKQSIARILQVLDDIEQEVEDDENDEDDLDVLVEKLEKSDMRRKSRRSSSSLLPPSSPVIPNSPEPSKAMRHLAAIVNEEAVPAQEKRRKSLVEIQEALQTSSENKYIREAEAKEDPSPPMGPQSDEGNPLMSFLDENGHTSPELTPQPVSKGPSTKVIGDTSSSSPNTTARRKSTLAPQFQSIAEEGEEEEEEEEGRGKDKRRPKPMVLDDLDADASVLSSDTDYESSVESGISLSEPESGSDSETDSDWGNESTSHSMSSMQQSKISQRGAAPIKTATYNAQDSRSPLPSNNRKKLKSTRIKSSIAEEDDEQDEENPDEAISTWEQQKREERRKRVAKLGFGATTASNGETVMQPSPGLARKELTEEEMLGGKVMTASSGNRDGLKAKEEIQVFAPAMEVTAESGELGRIQAAVELGKVRTAVEWKRRIDAKMHMIIEAVSDQLQMLQSRMCTSLINFLPTESHGPLYNLIEEKIERLVEAAVNRVEVLVKRLKIHEVQEEKKKKKNNNDFVYVAFLRCHATDGHRNHCYMIDADNLPASEEGGIRCMFASNQDQISAPDDGYSEMRKIMNWNGKKVYA